MQDRREREGDADPHSLSCKFFYQNMTSNIQNNSNYCQLDISSPECRNSRKLNAFFLFLSFVLGTETLFTAFFMYSFIVRIQKVQEEAQNGEYPLQCVYKLFDPDYQQLNSTGIAGCDLFIEELKYGAHKRLLWDVQNSIWEMLGENNITQVYSPAIHVGAEQQLKQYQHFLKTGRSEGDVSSLDRLRWDNTNGQVFQEGLMRLSPEGEIVVPRDGLYFVYSQVSFALSPQTQTERHPQLMQYLYKKTAHSPIPKLLVKAAVTPCVEAVELHLQSSHQGALFHLRRGDRLSLHVLDSTLVLFPQHSTYFGAFMVT